MVTETGEEDSIVYGDSNGRRREQRCRFQRKFSKQNYGRKVQYVHFTLKYRNMWGSRLNIIVLVQRAGVYLCK
jgi:hypothetical protein